MTGSIGVGDYKHGVNWVILNRGNKAKLYSDLDRLLEISKLTSREKKFQFYF